jgi:hypothetical protein
MPVAPGVAQGHELHPSSAAAVAAEDSSQHGGAKPSAQGAQSSDGKVPEASTTDGTAAHVLLAASVARASHDSATVVFVAAGQPPVDDSNVGSKGVSTANVPAGVSGDAGCVVVPLPIPFVLPPTRYCSSDVFWTVDGDPSPGLQDSLGRLRGDAVTSKYGYNQQELVQPYFKENN